MIKKIIVFFLCFYFVVTKNNFAEHSSITWKNSYKSIVRVLPTWPGYKRPGFGAPPGTAPEGTGIYMNIKEIKNDNSKTNYLITAAHVISNAKRIEIIDYQNKRFEAKLIKMDKGRDLALLQAEQSGISASTNLNQNYIGDHVCVIGNSFGLGLSFSCGVISALGRKNIGINMIEDFIQTDAAVNPGSSGGALVISTGEIIGMVDAIFTKEADIDAGVNFAISNKLIFEFFETIETKLN